jgi:ketosteroid isomerase-like protein
VSQENVDVVRRFWDHFLATGELAREVFAAGFVCDVSNFRDWPEQQFYEGVDGFRAFLHTWTAPFEHWKSEVEGYHDAGEKFVTVNRQSGRARASGANVEMRFAVVYTLRDGLLTRGELYSQPAEALKAVGLEE